MPAEGSVPDPERDAGSTPGERWRNVAMSGIGQLFALLALDEADRAERIAAAREPADEGLDPARSETRASAWGRWTAERDGTDMTSSAGASSPTRRRAAHV
jgi:hypothetical protein